MEARHSDLVLPPISSILPPQYFNPEMVAQQQAQHSIVYVNSAVFSNMCAPGGYSNTFQTGYTTSSANTRYPIKPILPMNTLRADASSDIISSRITQSRTDIPPQEEDSSVDLQYHSPRMNEAGSRHSNKSYLKQPKIMGKAHSCEQCGKQFTRPSALRTHRLVHSGAKPFECSWSDCTKKFNVKSNLIRHLKLHKEKSSSVRSQQDFGLQGSLAS